MNNLLNTRICVFLKALYMSKGTFYISREQMLLMSVSQTSWSQLHYRKAKCSNVVEFELWQELHLLGLNHPSTDGLAWI